MTLVKVEKVKWNNDMSDWLLTNLEAGKYGMLRESLLPEFEHFEYIFIDENDALVFALTFNI